MRTITPFLYWETLNTNDGILFIPTNNEADDRMAIYTIDQVTDTDHATARLRHASFNAPKTINLTRTNGQLTTTDLADLKAVNIGTREDTSTPDYYAVENDDTITIWYTTEHYNDITIAHTLKPTEKPASSSTNPTNTTPPTADTTSGQSSKQPKTTTTPTPYPKPSTSPKPTPHPSPPKPH